MFKLNRGMIKLKGGADSPGNGSAVGAFCRVVGDADPYHVRTGLLHAAAALTRDGSVSAPPFFLSKSHRSMQFGFINQSSAYKARLLAGLLAFCTDLLYNESISNW